MLSQHKLVLKGKIVDKYRVYESGIGIDNGIITEIDPNVKGKETLIFEKELIFPGFIDTHVHPRVPGGEHKEDFFHLNDAALHGGITTVMGMPNTIPPISTLDVLCKNIETVSTLRKASNEGFIDIRFFTLALYDNLDELEQLAEYAIGYKIILDETTGGQKVILPFDYLQHALNKIHLADKPATIHCGGPYTVRRVLENAQPFDKINIAHLATAEELEALKEYKEKGYNVAGELTPHHALLTRDYVKKLGSYAEMKPSLQTEEDRLALIEGVRTGLIPFLATDHAPHTRAEKESNNPPFGVPGEDTLGNVVALFIKKYEITPQRMMQVTSYNAANFFGLTDRGRIEVGKRADITVLDIENPETISRRNLYTKCRWSPFEGWTFPGKVVQRVCNGKRVSYIK